NMFALWYLSLAVDEMRKRFGWTFFDIFYTSNKTVKTPNKALDNKPANSSTSTTTTNKPSEASSSKAPEPAKPKPVEVKPAPAPAAPKPAEVKPAPAPAPPKPVEVKPVAPAHPKPVEVKPTPAPEPPKPVEVKPEPPKPAEVKPTPPPAPAPVVPQPPSVSPPKQAPFQTPLAPITPIEDKMPVPIAVPNPPANADLKTTENGTAQDVMDKKLQESAALKENGENIKNNAKNATADFLSGESKSPSKIMKMTDGFFK
ncbi:uncharacterized protein LOC133323229, partial [Musca vetustissima]|uniref:uncharacterized protein LOC133323229 n=1 Tax=Musca vetustissima TaxID=27455 RepID=UPI002AB7747E